MRGLFPVVAAVVLVDTAFFAVLSPLLPRYAASLGLTRTSAGVLAGAFAAGVLVAALPSGLLAARLGLRRTLLLGLGLTAVTTVAFGLGGHLGTLVVTRFAGGIGSACSWTAALGWLARVAPPARRGELLGGAMSAAVVGALLGPVLGTVAAWVGAAGTFAALAAACAGLALWVGALADPGTSPNKGSLAAALGDARIRRPLGLIVLPPLLFGALGVLVPLALGRLGWDTGALGALYVTAAALEAVTHPLLGRWADRRGVRTPVTAGLVASIATLLALAGAEGAAAMAALLILASVAFGATFVPGMALLTHEADRAGIDGVLAIAVANLAWALGHAVGAPASGWLGDRLGEGATYLLLAALSAAVLARVRRATDADPRPARR